MYWTVERRMFEYQKKKKVSKKFFSFSFIFLVLLFYHFSECPKTNYSKHHIFLINLPSEYFLTMFFFLRFFLSYFSLLDFVASAQVLFSFFFLSFFLLLLSFHSFALCIVKIHCNFSLKLTHNIYLYVHPIKFLCYKKYKHLFSSMGQLSEQSLHGFKFMNMNIVAHRS